MWTWVFQSLTDIPWIFLEKKILFLTLSMFYLILFIQVNARNLKGNYAFLMVTLIKKSLKIPCNAENVSRFHLKCRKGIWTRIIDILCEITMLSLKSTATNTFLSYQKSYKTCISWPIPLIKVMLKAQSPYSSRGNDLDQTTWLTIRNGNILCSPALSKVMNVSFRSA